ncbi:hypothetical protein [Paenarthrobacter ureafaciens]|uniref:hypothetical protein n=1 Tax=Paenarthrobacter ureafaciens TaxID=37931 RepID=UPI0009AC5171|nr:hypothetical protein [Paenarthrobacter ureafaciens]GLU60910.1 hypothetical protein Pure01_34230 [Paenarthrobacter ureafaciens]GLU65180.1 hypothetical protein Pure02_34300 [Paenarthrobacter ureafaciens]GLU69387.1 hypothetical protein Pure03_33630 [Paenarthrobacter ureafaciens]GLU73610.1 hypothetical protein Pure04_33250 [Paenarthrobacter ureafaciens]GLU77981.1 hypothetical protein Pure05_34210 [Paenarthrobacter ureafaciens]
MNQTPENTTETNPFTKPGFIIAAALVAALIAATVLIFLLPKEQGNTQATPTQQASSATPGPTVSGTSDESVCGLPAGKDTALGTAPKSTWELVGTMAVPTDPSKAGPGAVSDDGLRSCFAQSPTGALYATANIWAASFNGHAEQVYLELAAESPTRDKAVKAIEEGKDVGGGASPKVQIAGFVIHSYTPNAAVVELAIKSNDGGYGAFSTSLLWEDGDWKLDMPAAGGGTVRQISDLSSFIPWAGV